MIVLSVDQSSSNCGWAKFSVDGKLLAKGNIVPDKKLDHDLKIHWAAKEISRLFTGVDELVLEDTYLSFNIAGNVSTLKYLDELRGAIYYIWIDTKYKKPVKLMASQARKIVGLPGHASKAEVQCWVLLQFNLAKPAQIKHYRKTIDYIVGQTDKELSQLQLQLKRFKKGSSDHKNVVAKIAKIKSSIKYQLTKLSDKIANETECDNNMCDAILNGAAYLINRK